MSKINKQIKIVITFVAMCFIFTALLASVNSIIDSYNVFANDTPDYLERRAEREYIDEKNSTMPQKSSNNNEVEQKKEPLSVDVPILLYHHITEGKRSALTPEKIKQDLNDIKAAGYNTIFYKELIDFVENGTELPQNPIIISFDDGYYSNYQYLFPLLKELDMKAEISIIGWSVGRDKYIDSDKSIIPHFTWQQALEMVNSEHVMIESHTYDMHKYSPLGIVERYGVLKKGSETEEEYAKVLKADLEKLNDLISNNLNYKTDVFTYPNGYNDTLSEKYIKEMNFKATATIENGINTITEGDTECLYLLKRICGEYTKGSIIEKINSCK